MFFACSPVACGRFTDNVLCLLQQADITYDAQTFLSSWFNQHASVANALGKPLLLEEFGKAVNVRHCTFCLLLCCVLPSVTFQWNVLASCMLFMCIFPVCSLLHLCPLATLYWNICLQCVSVRIVSASYLT